MESEYEIKLSNNLDLTKLPDLLTVDEVIQVLRIPQISTAKDYPTVVKNLIRFKNLPRIQLCKKLLFPRDKFIIFANPFLCFPDNLFLCDRDVTRKFHLVKQSYQSKLIHSGKSIKNEFNVAKIE